MNECAGFEPPSQVLTTAAFSRVSESHYIYFCQESEYISFVDTREQEMKTQTVMNRFSTDPVLGSEPGGLFSLALCFLDQEIYILLISLFRFLHVII